MEENKVKTFTPQEAAIISESIRQSAKMIDEKSKKFSWLITGIIVVLFVAVATMLIMVAQIVIEAWRFSSIAYKESNQLKIQEENIKNTVEQQKIMIGELQSIKKDLGEIRSKK